MANLEWQADVIAFKKIFNQNSSSFKQIFFVKDQNTAMFREDRYKTGKQQSHHIFHSQTFCHPAFSAVLFCTLTINRGNGLKSCSSAFTGF